MANFHRYFFIMPTLARFEREMHERVERGEGLTAELPLTSAMAGPLRRGRTGPSVEIDRERVGITWAQFSHLYEPFYVYQYATGISGAHALARGVLDGEAGAAERYLGVPRAPVSRSTRSTRCVGAGVDLASPEPVEETFAVLSSLVDRIEALLPGVTSASGPTIVDLLAQPLLAEGSVYERLRRHPDVPFDPQVGTGALVLDDRYREILACVHRGYLAIGTDHGLPMLVQTDTWRATGARTEASAWRGADLNRANADLVRIGGRRGQSGRRDGRRGWAARPRRRRLRSRRRALARGRPALPC